MALKIRRGTAAIRMSITPAAGEPLYDTDTKSLYLGDGTTVGGNFVGGIASGNTLPNTAAFIGSSFIRTGATSPGLYIALDLVGNWSGPK